MIKFAGFYATIIMEEVFDDRGFDAAMDARLGKVNAQYGAGNNNQGYGTFEGAPITEQAIKESNLPDYIKKAMIEHPIPTIDPIADSAPMITEQQKQAFKRLVGTGSAGQSKPQGYSAPAPSQQSSPAIDYSIIRMIVEDVVSKKLDEVLSKNNGSLSAISLSPGKIIVSDTKGHVFSAKLVHKGNVDDK